ncbi:MAG: hypothetical protein IPO98_03810 [Saprospiraceae bacterium]|nr:hypothetical protein [Saprospiraceae bacterium]
MRVFLISILKFILFTVTFYVVFICIWGTIFPAFLRPNVHKAEDVSGFTNIRLAEAAIAKNVDILFLGSSRAYRAFDNRIFSLSGYSSFNLGTSNQTPVQSFFLLKKYFANLQPKMVIFEVNPDIFSGDGTESTVDLISNTKPDINLLLMARASKNIKAWNSFIYSSFSHLIQNKLPQQKNNTQNDLQYIKGGFARTSDNFYHTNNGNYYYCHLNINQLVVFEKMILFLKNNGIRTILVQAPVVKKLYLSCAENERFDSIMIAHGDYYNFNLTSVQSKFTNNHATSDVFSDYKITDTIYFSDGQHLNQKGVVFFNQMILNLLKKPNNQ